MKIKVKKQQYVGRIFYTPQCPLSKWIAKTGRRKHLPENFLSELKDLGFEIEQI